MFDNCFQERHVRRPEGAAGGREIFNTQPGLPRLNSLVIIVDHKGIFEVTTVRTRANRDVEYSGHGFVWWSCY